MSLDKDAQMLCDFGGLPTIMGIWNKHYNEALSKRFKGLRVTGEMACFFKHQLLHELVGHENSLHRVLDLPMIAICAYNAEDLTKAFNPINLYMNWSKPTAQCCLPDWTIIWERSKFGKPRQRLVDSTFNISES